MRSVTVLLIVSVLSVTLPASLEARVVRFVVEQTRPYADGRSFGSVGPFVWIEGTAYMEVDPRDSLNAVIVNLDKAPRNARGQVEFSARFFMVKPADMARGNYKIVYGVNNRGNVNELRHLQFPFAGDPIGPGDGLIFRLGYTFVDVGWAGDIVSAGARLGAKLPVAVEADGRPIVAPIRIEYDRYGQGLNYTTSLKLPPAQGKPYQILIPKPDNDGLDVGGIRIVDIAAPVGTNTGWNLRRADLCGLSGSFFPFAVTKAERQATGDPRLSLEERYKDHAGFVRAVEAAAARLVKERFLLDEDAKTMIKSAETSTILRERAAP